MCRFKNAGVAGYAEAFRPVQSDSQTSEWYSYFENDVLVFYTLKQLPPINSLKIELFGTASLGTGTKYSKNFSSLFASVYSGSSLAIPNKSGSAYTFRHASS